MLKGLAVLGACAMLGPIAASAQVRTVDDAVAALEAAADAEDGSPLEARPLGNPGDWVTFQDYPPEALREELSGTTRVRLDLDAQGVPTRCSIKATSGSEVLDATTCARFMERARFHPVMDRTGIAVPAVFETSVRWSASDHGPYLGPDPHGSTPQPIDMNLWVNMANLQFDPVVAGDRTTMYDLEVNGTGGVTDCTITRGSGDDLFDTSLCHQLELNAAFEVSSSGPGRFSSGLTMPEEALRALGPAGLSHPPSRNYGVSAFIEEDGSISACRWIGRNAPAVDPWPICNRSSWGDQRDVDGKLVRGVVQLAVSQRELDELAK